MGVKGQKKTGGRVAGTPNKTSRDIAGICDASGKPKPAEYLLELMHSDETDEGIKIECAKILIPYTDRKMPTAIEQTNKGGLESATEDELLQRLKELE